MMQRHQFIGLGCDDGVCENAIAVGRVCPPVIKPRIVKDILLFEGKEIPLLCFLVLLIKPRCFHEASLLFLKGRAPRGFFQDGIAAGIEIIVAPRIIVARGPHRQKPKMSLTQITFSQQPYQAALARV